MPHSFVSVDAESLALRAPTDRRWRNGQFLALGYPDAYDAVPRLSSTKLARDMFTKADSRVSQSRMMAISTFSAGTSNAAYGGPSWSGAEVRSVKRIGWSRSPVYRIPRIREALIAAANRGVSIRLIVETPNRIEGQGEYNCLLALGDNVASACSVYYWPQENRAKDDNGKIGILHVKCAVADGHRMFLSSANFTEYAFTINMELGLLVTGGKLPRQVERHFERLIEVGHLVNL